MANTYNVTSVSTTNSVTTVAGTVNGQSVCITFPSQVFASTAAFQTFVQPLMLAAAPTPDAAKLGTFIA